MNSWYNIYKFSDSPYYRSKLRSIPSYKEKIGKDMIRLWNYIKSHKNMVATFYHGTSSVFLEESMKNGFLSAPSVRKAQDRENRSSGLDEVFVTTSFSYALFYASRAYEQVKKSDPNNEYNEPVIVQLEIPVYMIKEFSDVILGTEKKIYNEYNIPEKIFQIIAESIMRKDPIEIQAEILLDFILKSYSQTDNEFTIKYVLPTRFIKSTTLRDRDLLLRISEEFTQELDKDNKNENSSLYSKDINRLINLIPKSKENEPWALELKSNLYTSKIIDQLEEYSYINDQDFEAIKKLPNYRSNENKIKNNIVELSKKGKKDIILNEYILKNFLRYKDVYDEYRKTIDNLIKDNDYSNLESIFDNSIIVNDINNKNVIIQISRRIYLNELAAEGMAAVINANAALKEYNNKEDEINEAKKYPYSKENIKNILKDIHVKYGFFPLYLDQVVIPLEQDAEAKNRLYSYFVKNILSRVRYKAQALFDVEWKERNAKIYNFINEETEELIKEEENFANSKINTKISIDKEYLMNMVYQKLDPHIMAGQSIENNYNTKEYQKALTEYWIGHIQSSLRILQRFPEELSKDIDFMKIFYKYLIRSIEDNISEVSYIPKFLLSENIRNVVIESFIYTVQRNTYSLYSLSSLILKMPPYVLENNKVKEFCINYICSILEKGFTYIETADFYKIIDTNKIHNFMQDKRIENTFFNEVNKLAKNIDLKSISELYNIYIIDKNNNFKFLNNPKKYSFVENVIKQAYYSFCLYENGETPFDSGITGRIIEDPFVKERLSQDSEFRKNVIDKIFLYMKDYEYLSALPFELISDPAFSYGVMNVIKNRKQAIYIRDSISYAKKNSYDQNSIAIFDNLIYTINENISKGVYPEDNDYYVYIEDNYLQNDPKARRSRRSSFNTNTGNTNPTETATIINNEQKSSSAKGWYSNCKFSQFNINDENINPDNIYESFKNTYEKSTGNSWDKDKFFSRSQDWKFYGDQSGYVAVREQKSGMIKLTGMAGNARSILKGLNDLLKENKPIWGMVSKDIANMATRVGFKLVDSTIVKNNIMKIPSYVFGGAKIISVNEDGGVVFNYSDIGNATKYLIGNDQYMSVLEGFISTAF